MISVFLFGLMCTLINGFLVILDWFDTIMRLYGELITSYKLMGRWQEVESLAEAFVKGTSYPRIYSTYARIFFSLMLLKLQEQGEKEGIKVARNSSAINHLLFVDDAYIFFKANVTTCRKVRDMLQTFCSISGLSLNLNKTELLLGPSCKSAKKRWFIGILRMRVL